MDCPIPFKNGECVLWPSKENQSWSDFKTHKHFEPFQKVLVACTDNNARWRATLYSRYDDNLKVHIPITGGLYTDEYIIPYEGNEDKLGKKYKV